MLPLSEEDEEELDDELLEVSHPDDELLVSV